VTPALSRQYVKFCDVADFRDPEFLAAVRDIVPGRDPLTHIDRKTWEFAMLGRFLDDVGRLHDGTEALAVGAGDERIVFWLANRIGRVVATDIYGEGRFADVEAQASMLSDPVSHAPFPYRQDRLDVRWMDACALDFPDASFDVVFSVSSIEHFGSPAAISQAAREMARVLKPGGHAFVTTECYLKRHPVNSAPVDLGLRLASLGLLRRRATLRRRAGVDVFTKRELHTRIVNPSGLRLLQELDTHVSPESWTNLTVTTRKAGLKPATGEFWPHVLLRFRGSVFTSVALAFEKPEADEAPADGG
jgi:SAM-dependent methyltransferase